MKKLFFPFKVCLLTLIVGAALFGFSYTQATEPVFNESTSYEMVSKGYLTNPKQTKEGVIVTNNRHSEVYLVENGQLNTILSGPGCGRYTNLNKEKTLLGFKSINEEGLQAPAILDIKTKEVILLENYSQQCGQVSFANDGTIAYAVGDVLYIKRGNIKQEYPLGYYVNIVNISPDASQVAFSDPDGKTIILNLQTRVRRQVTESGQFNPVWSPDGRKLAIEGRAHAVSVYDLNQNRVFDLGSGFEPTWLENSNELVFSSPHYEDGDVFKYKGTSIRQVSFDGRVEREIMPISHEAPGEIAILDNGKIVVPFTNGNRRLSVIDLPKLNQQGSRIKAAQTEEVLVFIPKDQDFGRRLMFTKPSFEELEKMEANGPLKAPQAIDGGTIGLTAIPYVNQVWDVPASDYGCTGYGYVACAPTTSCMLLGYYGLIPKVAVTSRASGVGTVYYSWQVGRQYTSSNTNYTFSLAATGNGCTAKGGYGYMWNGGSPASKMRNFYVNNGVPSGSTAYDYTGLTKIRTETNANRPYSFCVTSSKTSGHLILVFRSDQKAVKVNGVWTPQASTGSIIVHDPYGDANNSSWPNWDGRYSTYDYQGYNNGYLKMNNAWGVTVNYSTAPVKNPTITPSSTSLSFGSVNVNATKSLTFTVSTKDLSANVSVSSNSSAFTVSPTSLGTGGGTVTVTFKPTAEQSYSGTLTLSSTGATSKTVSLSGSGTKPRISLTEKMNISQTKSNTTSKGWNSTLVRNMAYASGKLYLVYEHAGIKVVKSQSGDFLYDLNKTGVSGGALTLCDVGVFDGKVIACNLGTDTSPLKVYAWDDDFSAPKLVLETTNLGSTTRLGDCMGFTGNWTSGKLSFANDNGTTTRIVNYAVTNGKVATTPTVVNVTKDSKRYACSSSIRVQPDASGYWINGKDNALTRLNTSGVYQYEMPQTNQHGNGFSAFVYDGIQYAVASVFVSSTNYVGGAMQLMDASPGWAGATVVGTYPSAGLGTTANTNCAGCAIGYAGSNYVETWVLSMGQGLAYYTYGTPPTHTYQTTSLTVSPASLAFGNVITGQTKAMTFNVTGTMLTANSTVTSNSAAFTVSPASLGTSGGTVTVTFSPAAVQSYSGTITVSGGGLSKTVSVSGAGVDSAPIVRTINVSQESLSLSCAVDQTKTASFTVTGDNLTGDISVSSNLSNFVVTPKTLTKTGGVVTVTFNPSEVKTYNGTITLSSSGATSKTVAVTGTATALGAITFTEGWNQSEVKGNANANSWNAANTNIRNMAYGDNGKLYLVYEGNIIKVIESQTGKFVADMNGTGITGGWPALSDVQYFDGKVVASNISSASAPLKVYVWDGESSAPRVLLETTNKGGVDRLGDNIGVYGTWTDGKLCFANSINSPTVIVTYKITNGKVATTPTVINVTDGGNAIQFTSTVRVQPDETGYYINGKGGFLTRLNANGVKQYDLSQDNKLHNGASVFSYYGTNYAVAGTFLEGNYGKGAMQLYNVGSDWSSPSLVGTYPSAGLGTTNNTNGTGHAIAATTDSSIELWVLSTNQGVAYYKYGTTPNFDAISLETGDGIVSDDALDGRIYVSNRTLHIENMDVAKVDMYSLSGVRVLSVEKENSIYLPVVDVGVYIVVVTTDDGIIRREKLIVK